MEFQGYALAAVVLLLLAYVAPYLHRRRTVLAEARIDERYAEDLRLLAVRDARVDSPRAHSAIGEHGTVFFRRPEVMMSSLDESADVEHSPARTSAATGTAAQRKPVGTARKGQRRSAKAGEVRSLAKERARRHARISKRAALQKRGLAGGIALGALAIVAWVLALSAASWPVVIAAVATGVVGLYFIGFSYVVGEISAANIRDREAIEDINKSSQVLHAVWQKLPLQAQKRMKNPNNVLPKRAGMRLATSSAWKHRSTKAQEPQKANVAPEFPLPWIPRLFRQALSCTAATNIL